MKMTKTHSTSFKATFWTPILHASKHSIGGALLVDLSSTATAWAYSYMYYLLVEYTLTILQLFPEYCFPPMHCNPKTNQIRMSARISECSQSAEAPKRMGAGLDRHDVITFGAIRSPNAGSWLTEPAKAIFSMCQLFNATLSGSPPPNPSYPAPRWPRWRAQKIWDINLTLLAVPATQKSAPRARNSEQTIPSTKCCIVYICLHIPPITAGFWHPGKGCWVPMGNFPSGNWSTVKAWGL